MEEKGDTTPSPFTTTEEIRNEYSNTIEKVLEKKNNITKDRFVYKYFWVVEFKDNTKISQYDSNGEEVLYKEVLKKQKESPITKAWFIPFDNSKQAHGITLNEGQKLILVRRRVEPWCTLRGRKNLLRTIRQVIYLIGYEETIKGEVKKTVLHINELGDTILNNNFNFNYIIEDDIQIDSTDNVIYLEDIKTRLSKDGKLYREFKTDGS
jgi:hypothetical protein